MSMEITMFRLLDKKVDENSVFVNADGSKDTEKKQDFNNRYLVLNPYWILIEGKRETRQFIKGCEFFDPVRQAKEGYVPTVENSVLEFKAGGDIMADNEDDVVMITWLKDHPHNTSSPFHKEGKHDAIFFTYDPKKVQEEKKKIATIEDEAMQLILALTKDPERLRAVGNLFEETQGLQDETEIYLGLREIAKENPSFFNTSIADKEKSFQGDIRVALKLGVINRNAKGFYLSETEGPLYDVIQKDESKAIAQFAKFLMSKEGKEAYKQMSINTDVAQLRLNAPAFSEEDEKKEPVTT